MLQPLSDTLSCDSALLHQYRADEAYNYARELQAQRTTMRESYRHLNLIGGIG